MKRYIFAILSIVLSSGQYHAMEDSMENLPGAAQLEPLSMDALVGSEEWPDFALFNPTLAQRNRAMGDYSATAEFPSTDHLTQSWDERMNAPGDEPFNPFSIQDSIRFAREDAATTMTTIARGEHASEDIAPVTQPAIRTGGSKGIPGYCPVCLQHLTSLSKLSNHIQIQHPLSKDNFACPKCPKKFQLPDKLKHHITIVHPKRLLQCTQCESTYKSQQALKLHMKDFHDGRVKTEFPCSMCQKRYKTERSLKQHMKTEHQKDSINPDASLFLSVQSVPPEDSNDFAELQSSYALDASADLLTQDSPERPRLNADDTDTSAATHSHLESQQLTSKPAASRQQCTKCNKTYTSKHALNHHIQKAHRVNDPFNCDICSLQFISEKKFKQHRRQHTTSGNSNRVTETISYEDPSPFQCPICHQKLKSTQNLSQHIQTEHPLSKDNFACPQCQKKFQLPKRLKHHIALAHSERTLQCTQCESTCKTPQALKQHIKDFHDERVKTKFTCSMCPNKYSVERNLKQHMRDHLKECPQNPTNPDVEQFPPYPFNAFAEEDASDFVEPRSSYALDTSEALGTSPHEEPSFKRRKATASIALAQDYTELATQMGDDTDTSTAHLGSQQLTATQELYRRSVGEDEPLTNLLSCPQCQKKFQFPDKLKRHLAMVHPERLLQCTQCDSTYKTPQTLRRHIKETHERTAQMFRCSKCTSKFRVERHLKDHMKKHSAAEKS